jgi:putative salt-induced outer membrane protein
MSPLRPLIFAAFALAAAPPAHAQVQAQATVKPDGRFRASFGLGASVSTGNSKSSNLSMAGEGVRATERDKTTLYGSLQYARSSGTTTGEQLRLGGRQDHDIGETVFAFGGLDFERNKFSNLKLRSQLNGGLGYHAIKSPTTTFDLFGGLGYTADKYFAPALVGGATRDSYGYLTLMLGEESTHRLSDSTSFKQRLTLLPNLRNRGEYRANWDAGIAVAMSKVLNLTVGLAVAHNSDPGPGRKATDTLLTTGVSVNFD